MIRPAKLGQRYAFVAAGVTFVALLMAAGLRAAPGVLMIPWEKAFGWNRGVTSGAAAIGILLYGLVGPFAAAIMQRFGIKRTVAAAFVLMAAATGLSLFMTTPWQLVATWGVMSGLASGCVALVLAATVVNRWFVKHRGLAMGILTASTSTGALIFLPLFTALAAHGGWKPVAQAIAAAALVMAPVALLFLPERPQDVGVEPFGSELGAVLPPTPPDRENPAKVALLILARAVRKRDFWLLAGTFFVCGFTTNGLIGAHMISLCADEGLAATTAGGLMAAMGVFDLIGTTASGWLTDRYDPRKLLFVYYGLRGLSLIYLPFSDFSIVSLSVFALFYGLDWIATVPPTLRLANQAFGDKEAPVVFGWIAAAHQLGAASAAFMAGSLRTIQGNYLDAFIISGATAVLAAFAALMIGRGPRPQGPALATS